jgi:hypothetical protein
MAARTAKDFMLVATYVSPGVSRGGGGFVIVGGKLEKVPPREPALQKTIAALEVLESIEGIKGATDIRKAAEKMLMESANELRATASR